MSEISLSLHQMSINVQRCPQKSKDDNERPQILKKVLKCPQCTLIPEFLTAGAFGGYL